MHLLLSAGSLRSSCFLYVFNSFVILECCWLESLCSVFIRDAAFISVAEKRVKQIKIKNGFFLKHSFHKMIVDYLHKDILNATP